jgi:hypothetical protein
MQREIETEINGLTIKCTLITGDWYGDKSVSNGVKYLDPYVEDIQVISSDGSDVSEWLTDDAIINIEEMVIDQFGDFNE